MWILLQVIFWVSVAGVLYSYGVYPILIWCCAQLFGRRANAAYLPDAQLPSISILIAAHNEEAVIADRLRNALSLDYPPQKLEVLIASDGSTDRTANVVRSFAQTNVRLLDFPENRGKASTLNLAMLELRGQIILLSDANTYTEPNAARALIRWFADPRVGAVCGKLVLTDSSTGKNVDGLYWRYETFLKSQESRLGALLGSNGAIYAIRRDLLEPIPPNTIIDDFVIPLLAVQRSGCSIIYDHDAIAHEETAPDISTEFRRRARIGAGGWQAISLLWRLLNPRRGWIAFTFFSHKILRWLCPFFLAGAFLANCILCRSTLYAVLLACQAGFYVAAFMGGRIPTEFAGARFLRLANMFVNMNVALGAGFFRWLLVRQTGVWKRTERLATRENSPEPSSPPNQVPESASS